MGTVMSSCRLPGCRVEEVILPCDLEGKKCAIVWTLVSGSSRDKYARVYDTTADPKPLSDAHLINRTSLESFHDIWQFKWCDGRLTSLYVEYEKRVALQELWYNTWLLGELSFRGAAPVLSALSCLNGRSTAFWTESGQSVDTEPHVWPGLKAIVSYDGPFSVRRNLGARRLSSPTITGLVGSASNALGPQASLLAQDDVAALLSMTSGKLTLSVWNVASGLFEQHVLASKVRMVASAWAQGSGDDQHGLITCWVKGGAFSDDGPALFECAFNVLFDMKEPFSVQFIVAVVVMFFGVTGCVLMLCTVSKIYRLWRPWNQQVNPLLTQLQAMPSMASLGSVANTNRSTCLICFSDVSVKMAFVPCGHTACRSCAIRLLEMGRQCHSCRGAINNVQVVNL